MVKEGYQQTEIGVIPEDWNVKQISEIADIDPENLTAKTHAEYEFKYISLEDVERGSLQGYSNQIFCTAPSRARQVLRSGDILLSTVRPNLKSHLLFKNQDTDWVCSTGFSVLRCKKSISIPEFIFFHLFSGNIDSQIETLIAGSNYPAINSSDVRRLKIPVSTIEEQRAIAQALSDVDTLITALDKLIAKKRNLKTATMQQLLTGNKRLLGFGKGQGYKQTEVGVIPEDWDVSQVTQITLGHKQGYYTKERYVKHGTRLVRITDLYNPKIDYESMPMLSISDNDFDQYKISRGDFLFARSGAIGRYGIVEDDVDAIFGSYIIRFNFNTQKLLNSFFGYLFETQIIWKQLLSITQGSSNININAGNIKALKIPLPHSEEQRAIATVLSDMDAEIAALESRLAKTQAIKQGMMQELLTGRTRLV